MQGPPKSRLGQRCWPALLSALVLAAALLAASETALGEVAFFFSFKLPSLAGPMAILSALRFLIWIPAPTIRPRDADGQLCEAATLFNSHVKAYWVRSGRATRAFEAACRRVIGSLEPGARAELDRLLREGALLEVLRAESIKPDGAHIDDWRTCGSRFERKAVQELEGGALEVYQQIGRRPLQERVIEASEVGGALQLAEVARFDARVFLAARLFNSSIRDLNELHPAPDVKVHSTTDGAHGYEDPICRDFIFALTTELSRSGPGSLLEWLLTHGLMEAIERALCHRHLTLKTLAATLSRLEFASWGFGDTDAEYKKNAIGYWVLAHEGRAVMGSNVNVLRLPNWTRGEIDVHSLAAALGLGEQVEHAHNFLWMGASPGGIHSDIQDNVLVQITGTSDVFLVPANCSLALDLSTSIAHASVTSDWIRQQEADFPFFLVRLRPGDGLAIPSNTMHTVLSQDPGRIGMNFFLEPRHGRMQWPGAPANFFNYAPRGRLAMRTLWVKAVKDLWERREAGTPSFIMHGERQEIV